MEECAGYCLYRKNDLETSFILTGDGANGKSTFLESLECMIGQSNVSNLDIAELDDRFSTVMLAGKLANIGDDISNEFLQGKTLAVFKKIVSANSIKAENKGQDVFFFKPYTKLLFSANTIPRMQSKGFGAIKRRIAIIPFNAHFSKNDPDYDSSIKWKLKTQSAMEYLIQISLEGLKRALAYGFTESQPRYNSLTGVLAIYLIKSSSVSSPRFSIHPRIGLLSFSNCSTSSFTFFNVG